MKILVAGNFTPPEICPVDCTQNCIDALNPYCDEVWASLEVEDVKKADAMILPGGLPDVNPAYWGAENTGCSLIDDELDKLQMDMLDEAVRLKKPVLGICRGYQLLAVYFGATLCQDIKESRYHKFQPDNPLFHDTYCIEKTFMQKIYGNRVVTNSAHHQAIENLPDCLEISQVWINDDVDSLAILQQIADKSFRKSTDDCVIEAVYHKDLPIIGVQWHPEMTGKWISKEANSEKLYEYFFHLNK